MKRIVVKVGTSTLTGGAPHIRPQNMLGIVQQAAALYQRGYEIILVSSGAQAAGRERLKFPDLPRALPVKQMLAAVGQSYLMRLYGDLFDIFEIEVAQVLLTRDDLSIRTRYLNARDTLLTLIEQRIVPIINENDTVATDEIRVGDNDNLSALVASALDADLLIMLTDQPGLFTADPRQDPAAELITSVPRVDGDLMKLAGGAGTASGTGGMLTKLQAAQTSARSGVPAIIAQGAEPNVILRIIDGEALGTRFEPTSSARESRKRWLLTDRTQGAVHIDGGAERALRRADGASLLPVGITQIDGDFKRSATVSIYNAAGAEIAHGLTNYASDELRQIVGKKSSEISDVLGYSYGDAAIHRNYLVLLD